jgi:two-component system, chemotaxis family, protein-glutamate methylesterase/glutaminase
MAPGRDIIVVAASAGGLEPLRTLLRNLPPDLPAALFVVLHVPATGGRTLPRILDRAGPLPASAAVDGDRIQPGRVYVAPPDQHLLVIENAVRLSRAPRQNGVRPAADPLFRSAALHAGPRVTGVVLSGTLDDAALGSGTVERRGGRVVVQDPDDADYEGMPRSAIAATRQPVVAAASSLGGLVTRLAKQQEAAPPGDQEPDAELVAEVSGLLAGSFETDLRSRTFSDLTCPDCGGPLYLSHGERTQTYDCLVGHRWTPQSLLEQHSASVERAIWAAIRSLEERAKLSSRLASTALTRGRARSAGQFAAAAQEAKRSADTLRAAVTGMTTEVAGEPEGGVS